MTKSTCGYYCSSRRDRFKDLYRLKITHDLASIPVGSTIQAISYHFNLHSKYNSISGTPAWALYTRPTTGYASCSIPEYQGFGTTPISNVLGYYDLTPGQWHQFDILPAYYSLFVPGQKSSFGVREANFDAPNIYPGWAYYGKHRIHIQSADNTGTTVDPYLEITYLPPG